MKSLLKQGKYTRVVMVGKFLSNTQLLSPRRPKENIIKTKCFENVDWIKLARFRVERRPYSRNVAARHFLDNL
jgi:hypothetical protein